VTNTISLLGALDFRFPSLGFVSYFVFRISSRRESKSPRRSTGRVGDPSYGRQFSDIALARRGPRNTKSRRAGLSKTRSAERAEPPRNRHCCTLDSTAGVASFLGTRFTTHRTTGYDRRGKRPSPRRTDCATGSSACLPKRGLAIGGGSHTPRFPHVSATTSLPTRMAQ
jgi:hypothetical protein